MLRRGGVRRGSGLANKHTGVAFKVFVEDVAHDTITYTQHATCNFVAVLSVVYVLRRRGRVSFGFVGMLTLLLMGNRMLL